MKKKILAVVMSLTLVMEVPIRKRQMSQLRQKKRPTEKHRRRRR